LIPSLRGSPSFESFTKFLAPQKAVGLKKCCYKFKHKEESMRRKINDQRFSVYIEKIESIWRSVNILPYLIE